MDVAALGVDGHPSWESGAAGSNRVHSGKHLPLHSRRIAGSGARAHLI